MVHHLVVLKQFLGFVRGDIIADAAKIRELLESEYKRFVTRVIAPNTSKG
jgi:hypothetical protein